MNYETTNIPQPVLSVIKGLKKGWEKHLHVLR